MISINWSTNLNFYKLSTKLFSLFSSVFTTPNGQVVNGNKNNTLFIYPIEAHDYGVYSVVYTDLKGCISNYTFEVIQVNPLGGGYYRNSVWTYGRFTAPVCLDDNVRIRLQSNEGTSIYTTPNGQVIDGNSLNTLFFNPIEPQDFGTYTIEHTDINGCANIYYFEVISQSQESGGYTTSSVWTHDTFEALACLVDDLSLRLNINLGTTIYTKPNGENVNGNVDNTLFVNQVESIDFGIYTVEYTDENNCVSIYHFNVSPNFSDMTPPDAICFPNISINLDQNGTAVLDVTDINNGFFDACGPVEVGINPTVLTCADGAGAVVDLLVEVNRADLSSTCSTQVEINDPFGACCPAVLYVDNDLDP